MNFETKCEKENINSFSSLKKKYYGLNNFDVINLIIKYYKNSIIVLMYYL